MFAYLLRTMRQRIEWDSIPLARKRNLASELTDFLVPAVIASRSTIEVVQMIAARFNVNLVGRGWIGDRSAPTFNQGAIVSIPIKFLPPHMTPHQQVADGEGDVDATVDDGESTTRAVVGNEGERVMWVRWDFLTKVIPFNGLRIAVHSNPTLFASFAMNPPVNGEEELFQPWQDPTIVTPTLMTSVPRTLLAPRAYRTTWTLTSPMAHGADQKTGNVSLFRRQRSIDPTTQQEHIVPYVAGNAVRGLWRDQIMFAMLDMVGLNSNELAARTAHALLAGGTIEQGADTATVDVGLRNKARRLLPAWSLLGGVMHAQIMRGILRVSDAILLCRENAWLAYSILSPLDHNHSPMTIEAFRASLKPADDLTQLRLLTRHAHRDIPEADGIQMLTNTEVVLNGATMLHSFHVLAQDGISTLALSCMAHTINDFAQHPFVGGGAARSLGQIAFSEYTTSDGTKLPPPDEYVDYVAKHRDEIRAFLLGTDGDEQGGGGAVGKQEGGKGKRGKGAKPAVGAIS
jgi:hypothetical protein